MPYGWRLLNVTHAVFAEDCPVQWLLPSSSHHISTLYFLTKERIRKQKNGHFYLWHNAGPSPSIPINVRR
jgi:hypothetical protein